jgi:hypothetical protein
MIWIQKKGILSKQSFSCIKCLLTFICPHIFTIANWVNGAFGKHIMALCHNTFKGMQLFNSLWLLQSKNNVNFFKPVGMSQKPNQQFRLREFVNHTQSHTVRRSAVGFVPAQSDPRET